jgi:hypothetical protein
VAPHRPLLVVTASDGSSLVLGELDGTVVFEHQGHGPPEPLHERVSAFLVELAGGTRVVFCGEADPRAVRVELEAPHASQTAPVKVSDGRAVWMTFPAAFGPGEARIAARAIDGDGRVIHEERFSMTFYAPTSG